ncbi:MAG: hypothetical protein OER22_12515 [Gammaproteobacteria bacterium]|nr:hypothetical protein [Gammaproteobacteria bacterium]MDH3374549.1 hypothetical protein [Gammaproteobacteria bacterium]MDH3408345.1 hypothetical protein [Gammaproteobacteria bacterium]MDH3553433.1 hypothetical protein [Gammaproteobacteria bacterium]
MNKHDRWAVGVFTTGQQIGFLPSDARDSMTLLRGEPIEATVARLIGGTNWFSRTIQGQKRIGVVLKVTKPFPEWSRTDRLNNLAKPFDDAVRAARALEKSGDLERAIDAYRNLVGDIADFTESNKFVSAHRYEASPVDRLSLLLEKTKRYEEALSLIID